MLTSGERMIEHNVHAAVAVLDVEHYSVAAYFAPVLDDPDAVVDACHQASEVDGSDFKVLRHGNRLLDDGRCQNAGNKDLFSGFQIVGGAIAISFANRFSQLARSEVGCPLQIVPGDHWNTVAARGGVVLGTRRCDGR